MANKVCLDRVFYAILNDLVTEGVKNAAKAAEKILSVTENYLSVETYSCLKEFYNLYFSDSITLQQKKDDINKNVDDLFEQAQKMFLEGSQLTEDKLVETLNNEKDRLGLSGLQKKLESLITLEEGLKEKLIPILSSMQFEDSTRQRLDHILFGFAQLIKYMHPSSQKDLNKTALNIASNLSSIEETEIYYEKVMHDHPPSGLKSKGILIEF